MAKECSPVAAVAAFISLAIFAVPQDSVKGVSGEDLQKVQALIDACRRQDPLVVTELKDNLYLAKGGPAGNDPNVGFVVANRTVILVNNKNRADAQKAVLDEIAKVPSRPVKTVILLDSDNETGISVLAGLDDHRAGKHQETVGGCHRPQHYPGKLFSDQDC